MQYRIFSFACAVVASLASLHALRAEAAASQYLYVYNTGSPGIYTGEFARYQLPDLALLETTAADGVASPDAFGPNGEAYFVDEAPQGAFAVFGQPLGSGVVAAAEQFSGVPCSSTSLATGPTGNFYVVQYCSGNVLEYKAGATKQGKAKKPIAAYIGGNFGSGTVLPTYAAVDHKGNLFVGDNGGGVTFFAAGSKKPVVVYPTGHSQAVTQIVVDANNEVWSVHYAGATLYDFANETLCVAVPSGPVERADVRRTLRRWPIRRQAVQRAGRQCGLRHAGAFDRRRRGPARLRRSIPDRRPVGRHRLRSWASLSRSRRIARDGARGRPTRRRRRHEALVRDGHHRQHDRVVQGRDPQPHRPDHAGDRHHQHLERGHQPVARRGAANPDESGRAPC